MNFLRNVSKVFALCSVFGVAAACSDGDAATNDSDLTSVTARERALTFEGLAYVYPQTPDTQLSATLNTQARSAFGGLREAYVSVASRELRNIDPKTITKEDVTVVEPNGKRTPMTRVRYRYSDQAIVPAPLETRSSLNLALLNNYSPNSMERVLKECTANNSEAREFATSIWYVFNPSLENCKAAMAKEQQEIDAAGSRLTDPETEVTREELNRLYLPITVKFEPRDMTPGTKYPEYDRLFAGGVQPGKLVTSMLYGVIAHAAHGETIDLVRDIGYREFMAGLRIVTAGRPNLKLVKVEPAVDLTTLVVGEKSIPNVTIQNWFDWQLDQTNFPGEFGNSSAGMRAVQSALATQLYKRWLTFEESVNVQIGNGAAKNVVIQTNIYFGSDGDDSAPHHRALENSDVVLYSGHSYIGNGPLDPSKFKAKLPPSYQLFFFNGCVSFNYYNKGFFDVKPGGTANLETITNGLEAHSIGNGKGIAQFLVSLLGERGSYRDLLAAVQKQEVFGYGRSVGADPMRVVDGERDNVYSPVTKPIHVMSK